MPESYQITFFEAGSLSLVADYNNALDNYTDDAGALMLEFGPMMLVACPEDSRSDQFVQYLMGAARYFFADAHLFIDLMADGGTLEFSPAQEADGSSVAAMADELPADIVAQLDSYLQSQVDTDGGNPVIAAQDPVRSLNKKYWGFLP